MKTLKLLLVLLIGLPLAAAAALTLVNIRDEAPSIELQTIMPPDVSFNEGLDNAYYYLLGFGAPPDTNPARAARDSVQRHNAAVGGDHREISLAELEENLKGLPFNGDSEALCQWREDSCLNHFKRHRDRYEQLVRDNALLIDRYQALIGHSHYQAALKPSFLEPYMPEPQLLYHAQQLFFYRALSGDRVDADAVEQDLSFWRLVMSRTNIVVDKLLAAQMIGNNAAFQNELADSVGARHTASLHPLNEQESDLDPMLWHQLRESLWMVDQIARYEVSFYPDTLESLINSPLGKYFLKTTATKNLLTDFHAEVIAILNREPSTWTDPLEALEDRFERRVSGMGMIYNPVGKYFFVIDTGPYVRYAHRILDLKGYLALLVLKRQLAGEALPSDEVLRRLKQAPGSLRNPYDGSAMGYDAATRTLYFEPAGGAEERIFVSLGDRRSGLSNPSVGYLPRYYGWYVSRCVLSAENLL